MENNRAGAGEGPDAGTDGKAHDVDKNDPHKAEKVAKAGRENFDPNEGAD